MVVLLEEGLLWYNIDVQPPWVGIDTPLDWRWWPMTFSLQEVIMMGMFLLALLTYLKRK